MLHQPRRWLPGLVPLALLAGGALWWKQAAIEADLAERATRAIAASSTVDGKSWASVSVRGRDAVISGTAPSLAAGAAAEAASEAQSGVRRADAENELLPAANPFGWSARREGQAITLSGQVAPDGSRARLVEAARKALGGGEVNDLMTPARDIPSAAMRAAEIGIEQLGRVASGSATLSGAAFRFTGDAADAATKTRIEQALGALPQGVAAGGVNITVPGPAAEQKPPPAAILPPTPSWSAVKAADGALRLTGLVASEEARQRILAAAKASTTGPVTDEMTVAVGLPAGLEAKAVAALKQLQGLASGTAAVEGSTYSFTGTAADQAAFGSLAAAVRGANDGYAIGELAVEPPVVSPFTWSARKSDGTLTLSGFAPSEAARAAIAALAGRLAGGGRVVDEMRLASGVPGRIDFGALSTAALTALARLSEGSVQMSGNRLTLAGRTSDPEVAAAVRQALAAIGAPVLAVTDIVVPPPPPPPPVVVPQSAPAAAPAPAPQLEAAVPPVRQLDLPPLVLAPLPAFPVPPAAAPAGDASAPSGPPVAASSVIAPSSASSPPAAPTPVEARPAGSMPPLPEPAPLVLPPPDCTTVIQMALEGDRILFDYWKAEQRAEHGRVLDRLAAAIRRCAPGERIEIAGHADIHNYTNQNQKLSEDRAALMRGELLQRGIPADVLVLRGYAASRPVADNGTEEGRALNRRVEFHVLPRN